VIEGGDSESELESEEEVELESEPEPEADQDESLEHTRRENDTTREGVGFTTTLLASGWHRVLKVTRDTLAVLSGAIKAGNTHTSRRQWRCF